MPERIHVGYVRRAHGIKGAVVINPLSDDPDRFAIGRVLDTDNEKFPRITIQSVQPHKDGLLVALEGVTSRDTAETLRGTSFVIDPIDRRRLDPDEYWPDDLRGMAVIDPTGATLGTVVEVIEGGAQDRLRVAGPDGAFEVPFVAAIVTAVDPAGGRIVVEAPRGLFGESE